MAIFNDAYPFVCFKLAYNKNAYPLIRFVTLSYGTVEHWTTQTCFCSDVFEEIHQRKVAHSHHSKVHVRQIYFISNSFMKRQGRIRTRVTVLTMGNRISMAYHQQATTYDESVRLSKSLVWCINIFRSSCFRLDLNGEIVSRIIFREWLTNRKLLYGTIYLHTRSSKASLARFAFNQLIF